jgi:sulfatase maturation enzyme AslB (radical SAM superfamily)
LLDKGVKVIVTVSFDGMGAVHDYVRYPVKWKNFEQNLLHYNEIKNKLFDLDTWTTVSCLNVHQLPEIQAYCKKHNIKHQYAFLSVPSVLSVDHSNWLTANTPYGKGNDNTQALEGFLELEESVRPGIERFWV